MLEGRRYLEAFDDETFSTWVDTLPATGRQRSMMMADPALAKA